MPDEIFYNVTMPALVKAIQKLAEAMDTNAVETRKLLLAIEKRG